LRVAREALGGYRVDPLAPLLVRAGHAEDVRPLGPGVVGGARVGWPWQQLELVDRDGALAMDRAEAVGAGIAAADDHDTLALGRDEAIVRDRVALAASVLERQVLHGEVDAPELPPGHAEVARLAGAARQHERVELAAKRRDRHAHADVTVRPEGDALLLHDREAPLEDALLHLELGDAVAEEPADPVGALEDRDRVTRAVQLLGGGEPRGPGADDRDLLPGAYGGRLGHDPALVEGALADAFLHRLDRDRVVVDAEDARALAGRRAEPARPLGEVVGRVQALARVAPAVLVHEVVPVGDDVAERAALVT